MRDWGSTVGPRMRTRPSSRAPLVAVTSACVPGWILPSSLAVTSARHSSRPLRIRRNSSAPGFTTAPTVALRDEITPSSGDSTCVWFSRTSCACSCARVASTRALAVASAVRYWLICEALIAPVSRSVRARAALLAASAALASASARLALAWATSARSVSGAKRASTWPRRTRSPTPTRTSLMRRPPASAPMIASCQAARLPLAASVTGIAACCGVTTSTVSAGRGAAFFSVSLSPQPARSRRDSASAAPRHDAERLGGCTGVRSFFLVFSRSARWPCRDATSRRPARDRARSTRRCGRAAA